MTSDNEVITTTVRLMGGNLKVQCPCSKLEELEASVNYIEQRVQQLTVSNPTMNRENMVVIIALNLARELLQNKHAEQEHLFLVAGNLRSIKERLKKELSSEHNNI